MIDLLKGSSTPGEHDSKMLRLKRLWQGAEKPFGSAYTFAIKDTVTQARPRPGLAHPCPYGPHMPVAELLGG